MSRPVEISGVVITKNEEKNIARCLKSLSSVCDEILVLDSASTDKTVEIARSFPKVVVHSVSWDGFSATKNKGNALAKGSFILSLDADEELSSELQSEILQTKTQGLKDEAYFINRMTNYCGKWIHYSGWLPDFQLRLFPKEGSQWIGDHVHETLQVSPAVTKKKFKNYARHYSFHSIEDHVDRINKYSSLGALKNREKKSKIVLIFCMLVNPQMRFFKTYFLKLGFLDGFEGLVIAWLSAAAVFLKYAKALSKN